MKSKSSQRKSFSVLLLTLLLTWQWLLPVNVWATELSTTTSETSVGSEDQKAGETPVNNEADENAPASPINQGKVYVTIENEVYKQADGALWDGQLLEEETQTIDFAENMTALDVLEAASKANNLDLVVENGTWGSFIKSINKLGDSTIPQDAQWASWMVALNGENIPVGVDQQKVKAGDQLKFYFSIGYPSATIEVKNDVVTKTQGAAWEGQIKPADFTNAYYFSKPGWKDITVLDFFKQFADANHLKYEITPSSYGDYLSSINGLGSDLVVKGAKWPGWGFTVNGEFPEKGMGDTLVKPGDKISIEFMITWEDAPTPTPEASPSLSLPLEEVPAFWPAFRSHGALKKGDLESTSYPITADKTKLVWSRQFSQSNFSNLPSQPIIVNNSLVFVEGKNLTALNLENGNTLKTVSLPEGQGYASTAPLYADGMIFVSLDRGTVVAVRASNWEILWTYVDPLGGQGQNPLSYQDGILMASFYNPSGKANLVAIDVRTGQALWSKASEAGYYNAGGLISGSSYIVGSEAAEIVSYDLKTGEKLGSFASSDKVRSSVVRSGNAYYVVDNSGTLYKFGVNANGALHVEGSRALGTPVTATPSTASGRLYLPALKKFFVLDAQDLSILDQADLPAYGQGSPLVLEETGRRLIYFVLNEAKGALYSLKDLDAKQQTSLAIGFAPVLASNTSGLSDLETLFTPPEDAQNYSLSSPIMGPDGTIYYKNDSGTIFALQAVPEPTPPAVDLVPTGESNLGAIIAIVLLALAAILVAVSLIVRRRK